MIAFHFIDIALCGVALLLSLWFASRFILRIAFSPHQFEIRHRTTYRYLFDYDLQVLWFFLAFSVQEAVPSSFITPLLSSPLNGSSNNRMGGFSMTACAIPNLWRIPKEYLPTFLFMSGSRPTDTMALYISSSVILSMQRRIAGSSYLRSITLSILKIWPNTSNRQLRSSS